MRKSLLLLALASVHFAKAQLIVDSIGHVGASNGLSVNGKLTASTSGSRCLQLNNFSSTINRKMALLSQTSHSTGIAYNIYCETADQATDSNTSGRAIGIYSTLINGNPYAGEGAPGVRYSICGVNNNYGAAIYGATSGTWISMSQPYAGYFYGNTHVQGNLSVSGNISGVMLSNGINGQTTALKRLSVEDEMLSRKLQALTTRTYFLDTPRSSQSAEYLHSEIHSIANECDSSDPETINLTEEQLPLSIIEKQVYAKQHYGLSVNELEEVFPDLVYENEDGTKSINYVEMVPILVQAINELGAKVEALESGDGSVKKIETRTATNIEEMGESVTMLALGQNKPNPFGTSTSIEVSIPADVQKAFIYVYDLTGKKLQQIDIPARGNQAVTVNASSLTDGMYLYSLIADGKVVETRRMIVEK